MKTPRLAAAAAAALLAATTAQAEYTLNILHINDLHSRIEPINKYDGTCDAEDDAEGKCFGGVARVKSYLNERRGALTGQNVLTLDAGDQFQGSLFYSTYKGKATVEFMNMIGFDAMAVGNHEFDDGPEVLAEFMDAAFFPVISGNTSAYFEPSLKDKLDGYIIREIGGEKIGIVSVLATDTAETSSPGKNVGFAGEISYLKTVIPEIESQGVNKIIALTHVGLPMDMQIAAQAAGVDVIVGGHSHTYLSASDPKRQGPYPTWVTNEVTGDLVPIVQAYANSKYVGELQVTFDDEGRVIFAEGDTKLLDASVKPDADVAARVKELAGPIEELKAMEVGSSTAVIDGDRSNCRARECTMGVLVAEAMLNATKGQGVTIAIQNGGGLRASMPEGTITMGDVLTVLPFQNTVATFELTGAGIVEALENGVGQVEDGAGRFPQVAGMRYAWDVNSAPGSRIKAVEVKSGDGWQALDMDATYKVVTNNYMRGGGDGYKVFASKGQNAYDYGPGLEVIAANFIKANSPYTPVLRGNIVEGTGFGATAEAPKAEEPKAEAGDAMAVMLYTIKKGDSLWSIASKNLGGGAKWKQIAELNGLTGSSILKVDSEIKLPK